MFYLCRGCNPVLGARCQRAGQSLYVPHFSINNWSFVTFIIVSETYLQFLLARNKYKLSRKIIPFLCHPITKCFKQRMELLSLKKKGSCKKF
jgi:hypothetical protein